VRRRPGFLVLCLLLSLGISAQAQRSAPETPSKFAGLVRTAQGVPLPGATVRVVHVESGKAWLSWTDESGKFELPGLPTGRYRVEAELLGFEPASREVEFSAQSQTVEVVLNIAAPAKPAAPAAEPQPRAPAPAPEPAKAEAPQPARPGQPPRQPGAQPPRAPVRPGAPGQNLEEMIRQRLGQGGFQQVDPIGQVAGANSIDATPPIEPDPLGGAAASDSFLISGTVGRGATAAGDMGMLFGELGMMGAIFPGGFPAAEGAFPGPGGVPGAMGTAGQVLVFETGRMGGPPGGGPGRPGQQQGRGRPGQQGQQGQAGRRAQAQQGQGGQGQRGPGAQAIVQGGFGQGVEALWGLQRLMRTAANRTRFSFHSRYGNSFWDARPYSLTEPNPVKIDSYRASFGFNLGGPLVIPHVYNGREKTFYFVGYEFSRNRNPVDTFATVPLPQERLGDFTSRGLQLFDPVSNLDGPRTPFGGVIPSDRLDPAAVGLLRFIPLPNLPGLVQNFHLQARVPQSNDRINGRLMHSLSQRFSLQVTYFLNSSRSRGIQVLPELISRQSVRSQNAMVGLTQQWSQRLTHDTRFNWNRNRVRSLNRFAFLEDVAGELGITGISTDPMNFGVPQINFTNFADLNDPVPALRRNQQFRFMDNLAYARTKHTWRAGMEVRRQHTNNLNDPIARGAFTFTGLMTSQLDAQGRPVSGTGWDFADFLLGLPQSTSVRFGSSSTYFRNWGFVGYFQDDWRIHPRFSLHWGIRYEAVTPPIELFDHIANLDVNLCAEGTAGCTPAVAAVLPGDVAPFSGPLPRALIRGDWNNWAPRIGIAWRPPLKRNTTIRAGYSLFYNSSIYNQLATALANQPPHAQAQTRLTAASRLLTLRNGFPPEPPGTVPNTVAVDPNYKVGYAQIWNVSVETQVVNNWTVQLTYTGTKGTHLDLLRAPNRALPGGPLDTELRRLIPNAAGFTYETSGASSIYHAGQLRVQRRFARGFMWMGTYTFGKSLDNASSIGGGAPVVVQDDSHPDLERGRSSFDIRHQFISAFIWDLPFGERRRWASKGWAAKVLSNWQISGNVVANSGTPFTARLLGSAANNSGTGANFSERPDQIGSASLPGSQRTPLRFFNTDAFAVPAPGRFGTAGRNTIPGPGMVTVNAALSRFLRFGKDDQRRVDFRWEVQNLFNTPNFTGLGTVLGSSNYGRVLGVRPMRTMNLQMRVNF